MKLLLVVCVVVSLHCSVLGYGNHGQGGGTHRPNPHAMCRMILSSTGFRGTAEDCRGHAAIVAGEIDQVFDNKQRDVFSVWIAQTAALYQEDVMSMLSDDDDDDDGDDGARQQVLTLCERQKCFSESFKSSVRSKGMPAFCTVPDKTPETWLQEMWAAKHQIESGGQMLPEMIETFFCARAHNPHLSRRHQQQSGGRAGRHGH